MFSSIIYEDDSIIVVNKDAGVPVISGRGIDESEILVRHLEKIRGCKIYTVHRLDRETSGVIIFAKTSFAHKLLCMQFEYREVKKSYLAVVLGRLSGSATIDKPLYEFGSGRMGINPKGKRSVTDYKVIKQFHNASLLEVCPLTGRRHQIRVHLYSIGHPILGDKLYGDPRPVGNAKRLMLHASSLQVKLQSGLEKTFYALPDLVWDEVISEVQSS